MLAALAILPLSGCDLALMNPKGPVGAAEKQILIDSVAIMLAIVIPSIIAIAGFAWWYRASNTRAKFQPEFVYSGRVEAVIWSIPALTVMLLSGVIWVGAHQLDPAVPIASEVKPLEVQVVSLDWKWLFIYPEQKIASVNQLVAPVGTPLHLSITSGSVMTAFFVPQWGSMIYAMNHMSSQLNLMADTPGTYHGIASHFSGDWFANMHFDARAVSPAEFDAWVRQSAADGPPFDEQAFRDLERQSADDKPSARPLTDDTLFEDIVSQKVPPAPGPAPSVRPTSVGG